MRQRRLASFALFFGLLGAAASAAAEPAQSWYQLVSPTPPSAKPQTDAEKELGKTQGRSLPQREILQPTLDDTLPAYAPNRRLKLAGRYKAAASDVLPGLAKGWVTAFQTYYPGVRIEVAPPYAGSLGAKELVKGNIDFVFVSRELKPDDITDFRARFGYDPTSVPVSGGTYRHYGFLDAVGFVVNPANPINQLSFAQLDAAFSATRHRGGAPVTTWGQLGLTGEWADKPVHLYGVKPWNGFEEFIRQRVLSTPGHRGEWRNGVDFSETVFPIAGKVAKDRYALAYDGMAYLDAPVKAIAVSADAAAPAYPPSYDAVARADYPLSRLIFFNFNRAPHKPVDPVVAEFLRFVLSRQGQQVVQRQSLYLPLRARQAAASAALLQP